jgi:hypothetical protein
MARSRCISRSPATPGVSTLAPHARRVLGADGEVMGTPTPPPTPSGVATTLATSGVASCSAAKSSDPRISKPIPLLGPTSPATSTTTTLLWSN